MSARQHSPLLYLGGLLLAFAAVVLLRAMGMDTTVAVRDATGVQTGERVHNLELAQKQTRGMVLGGVLSVVGVGFVIAGTKR